MIDNISNHARESRNSGAVLKIQLINIRSRSGKIPVLVFEGDTDVGPYEVWISKLRPDWNYIPLPAKGKQQLLDMRARLAEDETGVRVGVYFFVDRDFDDLRGQPAGPDLFCTDCYSIENYFVSEVVLMSILLDELRCAGRHEVRVQIIQLFRSTLAQFLEIMADANKRIFRARRLNIKPSRQIEKRIQHYVNIEATAITVRPGADLSSLIMLEREPSVEECVALDSEFAALDAHSRHRGKFLLSFFLRWLDQIASACRDPSMSVINESFQHSFSLQEMTMRSLAARSKMPSGLNAFVNALI